MITFRNYKYYSLWNGNIYIVVLIVPLVYMAVGSYDKMGNRRKIEDMHYYMQSGQEFVVEEQEMVEIGNSQEKHPIKNAFVDMAGYLVILNEKDLILIDEELHIYKDNNGRKYIKAVNTQWDFFGYPVLR